MPIKLTGPWDEGFALDVHTTSSQYLGDDPYGNPRFDSKYSKIGDLLHSYKYKNRHEKLDDIMEIVGSFIDSWDVLKTVDFVLPVPPTKERIYQPASEVAREIASLIGASYSYDVLQKTSTAQAKDLFGDGKQVIQGTIIKTKNATREHNMLLVDDIYDTGTTLIECVNVLRQDENIKKIYVLTLTKKRT